MYVGDVNYNKNIPGLLQAFAGVYEKQPDIHLVLAGKGFITPSVQVKEIHEKIHSLGIQSVVTFLGHTDLQTLVALYNAATAYVQPSFAEGFGLPVLEAMACGTPVIAARTTSLPEIVSDSAILVDPYDKRSMTKAIDTLFRSKQLREDLAEKGLQRVRQFTWAKTAEETVDVYNAVLRRHEEQ